MIRTLLIFFLLLSEVVQAQYFQQKVDVDLRVRLNDQNHSLDGQASYLYTNRSPDTLRYIWFHLWPNAYKNDRTAMSEQMVQHNDNRFYFSKPSDKGYINQLAFEVNGVKANTLDHPTHIDIIQLVLPTPLMPGATVSITTPFHVQLPLNVSRGGHVGNSYQITQWFPKPAVYDHKGWHPMPYLDQGEFYSEFGDYTVEITLPQDYRVAATGVLKTESEIQWLNEKAKQPLPVKTEKPQTKKTSKTATQKSAQKLPGESPAAQGVTQTPTKEKTLRFTQTNVHDFAWFADKNFQVQLDTIQVAGTTVQASLFYMPEQNKYWKSAMQYIKRAIHLHSEWIGAYPFETISVVQGPLPFDGGMEYPTITLIAALEDDNSVDEVVFHEVGHNWFQGILASNERAFPWMDEGMNSYYDQRYRKWKTEQRKQVAKPDRQKFPSSHVPASYEKMLLETVVRQQWDQPINTPSEAFTPENYSVIAYYKAAAWMEAGAEHLGQALFDQCMQHYFQSWKFKHPYPADFQTSMETCSGRSLQTWFDQLEQRGPIDRIETKKKNKLTGFFNLSETDQYQYHAIAPALGYNGYDGLQLGLLLHNFQLPLPKWRYVMAPTIGLASGKINLIGDLSRHWYFGTKGQTKTGLQEIAAGLSTATFTIDRYTPEAASPLYMRFYKIAPYLKLHWRNGDQPWGGQKYAVIRPFIMGEERLDFREEIIGGDTVDVVGKLQTQTQFLQLKFGWENLRALYPFRVQADATVAKDFTRVGVTTHYFFNYPKAGEGLRLRAFLGAFFYYQQPSITKQFELERYHLNLTGANGQEDYTYSNYFVERNAFEGLGSQQIMMRDGGFKVRTDLLSSKVGKTDRWLAAINLTTTIPDQINPLTLLPFRIPLRAFVDIGSFAESWDANAETGRILFDAGLQVSLFKESLHIYIPILYSPVFRDYINSTLTEQKFWKKISFSIDIHDFRLKQWIPAIPF